MGDHWVRTFNVSDPQRHRKGFTVYKVTSIVYPRNVVEAKTEIVIWKRYSDFQKLHKDLKDRHEKLFLKDEFPSFVKPRLFGRFEDDVIEERRIAALALLKFVAAHLPLFMSHPMKKFMQKSYSVPEGASKDSVPVQSAPGLLECEDTMSESSNHSAFTDTDSSRSAVSSPTENLSKSGKTRVLEALLTTPSTSPAHSVHDNGNESSGSSLVVSVSSAAESSIPVVPLCKNSEPAPSPPSDMAPQSLLESTVSSPVEQKETSSVQHDDHSCPVLDYMTQAGYHVSQAMEHEASGRFEPAFVSYKNAISFLLSGLQDDPVEDRKLLVQKKAAQYLHRAEEIYHDYLSFSHSTTRSIPLLSTSSSNWNSLEAPISDLKMYKVLGVVSSVILTVNKRSDVPYIVKVLHKSPCPVDHRTRSITPANVPFMCRLFCFMENEHAVFLVLEQASGGGLWDHIRPYFEAFNYNNNNPVNELEQLFAALFQKNTSDSCLKDNDVQNSKGFSPEIGFFVASQQTEVHSTNLNSSSDELLTSGRNSMAVEKNEQPFPDVLSSTSEGSLVGNADVPDVLPLEDKPIASNVDTEYILRNSQKLLDSVNKTLCKSENATKLSMSSVDYCLSEVLSTTNRPNKAEVDVKPHCVRDRKPSTSRDRKPSAVRRSRSRIHFSCDDMFEGRARALSRSLDREALQMAKQAGSSALPVDTVRLWAAELVLALDALHRWGLVIGDLRPENLLLGRGLNIMLTYQYHWVCVDHIPHPDAIDLLYAAPEVGGIEPITPAADWWSYGAILFELLSGESLACYHPGGIQRYSTLLLPPCIEDDAANLLKQLLRYNAQERLGAGPHGVAKLKSHSFFKNIEWNNILLLSASV